MSDRFLRDLSLAMQSQDGMSSASGPTHCTACPLYMVQEEDLVYCIDTGMVDPDGWAISYDGELTGEVLDLEPAELPSGEQAIPFLRRWRFVPGAVAFTRRAVESYIAANRHNLHSPRVYVASIPRRLPEMVQLQEFLMTYTTTPTTENER